MKQIQERLGHSDFSATANICAHLDDHPKRSPAEAMLTGLGLARPNPENGQDGNISSEPANGSVSRQGERKKPYSA